MPDNGRLAKLIERRKRQERQNDRIRLHKNKLDNMRLEKLSTFFDWSKHLLKREHLTAEAKCVRNLENIYARQCKIEDEKKIKARNERKEMEERERKALGIGSKALGEGNEDAASPPQHRRKVTSASKQEQAKSFMTKVKTLSSGYRDNDPPQSYYKRKGLVPPDRLVTPEVSYSAQAQLGGGFLVPPSALHVKDLKKWHGIPENVQVRTQVLEPEKKPPKEERHFSLIEALQKLDDQEGLEILPEEDESEFGQSTRRSSTNSEQEDEIDEVQLVNIRPSTAPVTGQHLPSDADNNVDEHRAEESTKNEKKRGSVSQQKERGILLKRTSQQRPATAGADIAFQEESVANEGRVITFANMPTEASKDSGGVQMDKRLRMRRQSSAISFAELPPGRRRSSIAPPLALLHRRQSNVAAIHRSIQQDSKLLKPKSNKMKKKSGRRMGLVQSVMTNVENEVLIRKLKEKSQCLAEERQRRLSTGRVQSAPSGGRKIQLEENYPTLRRLSMANTEAWAENTTNRRENKGQKTLLDVNRTYSSKLDARVKGFLCPV